MAQVDTPIIEPNERQAREAAPAREAQPEVPGAAAPSQKRYPRAPDRDLQLVWRGKVQEDRRDLLVDTVPLYLQETIDPRALIADLPRRSTPRRGDSACAVEAHAHDAAWTNRMIHGDSLLVMNSLAETEALEGRVQMIYFDPPYGISFATKWRPDASNGPANRRRRKESAAPQGVKAFHDTWADGIHSFLAFLRDRLTVAHALLKEEGSLFLQIGDENLHLVRALLDEVFGRENFVAVIPFRKKTMPFGTRFIEQMDDFLLWYAKDKEAARHKFRRLYRVMNYDADNGFPYVLLPDGELVRARDLATILPDELAARRAGSKSLEPSGVMASGRFEFDYRGTRYRHPKNGYATTEAGMRRLAAAGRLMPAGNLLRYVLLASDKSAGDLTAPWQDTVGADDKRYVVQTNTKVVERCLLMTTDPGDLVLDPTCGAGTTAYVAEQWGRRWITIDTSNVALMLARQRLMAACFPSYLLADSEAGARKESEIAGTAPARRRFRQRIDRGFVHQRVPHITLKSIANNAEIDAISEQWQGQLAPLLQRLNGALDAAWTEWEVPREPDEAWPAEANEAHGAWWQARRNRQKAIEKAIARKAAALVFHDRPYEDSAKVRVAGPFTVESLSPHRGPGPDGGTNAPAVSPAAGDAFVRAVLDHLKGAGLQNTGSGERLEITELRLRAGGCHVNAEGRYQAKGREKRVAVAIGPQYGTVSQGLVCAAAREAARRFDTLVVCGFAFAPQLDEASPVGVGRLTVLKARMNQDLHMAEHLRATGAGKLFVVSGEPDIRVEARPDGRVTVEVVGIALFDPASGEMRAASADDVACWFVDTDYDGERFCVRQAYVLGGNDPYRKLKRALKAEIDEATWASLHAARSRPFPKPASGRIAVKVISHTGDEALRVIEVR